MEKRLVKNVSVADIPIDPRVRIDPTTDASLLHVQEQGPYLALGVTPSEKDPVNCQVERIISLDNASAREKTAFDKARLVAVFGKHVLDSGSSAVQAALFTLKIKNMEGQLERSRGKDVSTKRALIGWYSKRVKILKYLRRKV